MDKRRYKVFADYNHVVIRDRETDKTLLIVSLSGLRDIHGPVRKFALAGLAQMISDKLVVSWELMVERISEVEGITIEEV